MPIKPKADPRPTNGKRRCAAKALPTYDRVVAEIYRTFLDRACMPNVGIEATQLLCQVVRVLLTSMKEADAAAAGQSKFVPEAVKATSGYAGMTREQMLEAMRGLVRQDEEKRATLAVVK